MIRRLRTLALTACLAAATTLAACGSSDDDADRNLVERAQADSRFTVLVEAVQAAGLAETLSGPGPFTVFAPTNDAFVALLGELGISQAQLLADQPLLTRVLTYHVVPARVPRAAVPIGTPITTAQGGTVVVDATLGVTDARGRTARIVETDLFARNGVIHVIDKVLLPAP